MLRNFLVGFLFFVIQNIWGQSEPQFTQYMLNKYLVNTAYAGSSGGLDVSLLYRNQYVGLNNQSISSQGFNFNIPLQSISSGIGVTAINDLIGFQRSTYVSLNYDYRKNFKWGEMGVGIGGGIIQTSLDGSQLRAPDGNYDNGVNHNDALLPTNLQQGIAPDLSFGIYFNNDKYFAGASINHIVFASAAIKATGGKTSLDFSRNLFFTGGYDFNLSQKLRLMPTGLVKSDFKKVQIDIGGTFIIINNIITGISFRGYSKNMIDALAVVLGFKYKGVQLVYSYDINVSYLSKFNSGSHEISLSYRYPFKKKENRGYYYHNPRFN